MHSNILSPGTMRSHQRLNCGPGSIVVRALKTSSSGLRIFYGKSFEDFGWGSGLTSAVLWGGSGSGLCIETSSPRALCDGMAHPSCSGYLNIVNGLLGCNKRRARS